MIEKTHTDNDHLGANRIVEKIMKKGYKRENITDSILEYIIYECEFCTNERSDEKIKILNKILITKGPKELYVFDGFELDEITKEKTGYSHIIEIIDHFSKYKKLCSYT